MLQPESISECKQPILRCGIRCPWLRRGYSHLRISDCFDRCWIFECGRIAKIFAEVSGPGDPAHHFCVPSPWDVVDKNNFARRERFAEVPSYALLQVCGQICARPGADS